MLGLLSDHVCGPRPNISRLVRSLADSISDFVTARTTVRHPRAIGGGGSGLELTAVQIVILCILDHVPIPDLRCQLAS